METIFDEAPDVLAESDCKYAKHVLEFGAIFSCLEGSGREILERVPPDAFIDDRFREIYSAIQHCSRRAGGANFAAVADHLLRSGRKALAGIAMQCADPAFAYTRLPSEIFTGQIASTLLARMAERARAEARKAASVALESGESLDRVYRDMNGKLAEADALAGGKMPAAGMRSVAELREDAARGAAVQLGIPTLDDKFLVPRNLIVVGARPGSGKTSFALTVAWNMVQAGRRVGVVALEEDSHGVHTALVARVSGQDNRIIRAGAGAQWQRDAMDAAAMRVDEAEQSGALLISYGPATTANIGEIAQRMISRIALDCLIIDHLHQLKRVGREEHRAIGDAVLDLQTVAIGRCPVVLMAQLNRGSAQDNRQPMLYDLKGSGDIEQAARVAILLHRETREDGSYLDPKHVKANVAKITSGGIVGSVNLAFDGSRNWFGDCRCGGGMCGWRDGQ